MVFQLATTSAEGGGRLLRPDEPLHTHELVRLLPFLGVAGMNNGSDGSEPPKTPTGKGKNSRKAQASPTESPVKDGTGSAHLSKKAKKAANRNLQAELA